MPGQMSWPINAKTDLVQPQARPAATVPHGVSACRIETMPRRRGRSERQAFTALTIDWQSVNDQRLQAASWAGGSVGSARAEWSARLASQITSFAIWTAVRVRRLAGRRKNNHRRLIWDARVARPALWVALRVSGGPEARAHAGPHRRDASRTLRYRS
jgi:hypothetical protein